MCDIKPNPMLYANTTKLDEMSKLLERFPEVGELVIEDVLKDARSYVVREIPRIVPMEFAIEKGLVQRALRRRKVRYVYDTNGQSVGIEITGSPLKAGRFDHSPTAPPGKGNGNHYKSSVTIYKDRGKKTFGKIKGKGIFIAKTSKKGVSDSEGSLKVPFIFFVRTGEYKKNIIGGIKKKTLKLSNKKGGIFKTRRAEEKIRPISAIGIPQMIMSDKVTTPLLDGLAKSVDKNIMKDLTRSLGEMCDKLNR